MSTDSPRSPNTLGQQAAALSCSNLMCDQNMNGTYGQVCFCPMSAEVTASQTCPADLICKPAMQEASSLIPGMCCSGLKTSQQGPQNCLGQALYQRLRICQCALMIKPHRSLGRSELTFGVRAAEFLASVLEFCRGHVLLNCCRG